MTSTPPSYLRPPPPRPSSPVKSTSHLLSLLRLCVPGRAPLLPTAVKGKDGAGGRGREEAGPLSRSAAPGRPAWPKTTPPRRQEAPPQRSPRARAPRLPSPPPPPGPVLGPARPLGSPLSAEACSVAPEVPSMTLMAPRAVTARMALSAGW